MECSPRGGGNRLAECLEYATGVKLVENAVRAALGMPTAGVEQRSYDGCWAEVILHSDRPGVFDSLWIEPGTPVGGFSAANEAIGTLVLRFETQERLQTVMNDIGNYCKVILRGGEA